MKLFSVIVLLLFSLTTFAQSDNSELTTDRPDQTESSSVVPLHFFQIESGFIMEMDETDASKQKSYTCNTSLLRYGLLKNFEVRLGISYLEDQTADKINQDQTIKNIGLSPLYTGFKVKIADEKTWLPEIAFLGALVLPLTAAEEFKTEYIGPNMRFSFSHTLSDKLSLGYNLGAEWDGNNSEPGYFYSLVIGLNLGGKIGMFAESYGIIKNNDGPEHMLDAGFTYLILDNLQLDLSSGLGINEAATDYFISCGVSFRLPQ